MRGPVIQPMTVWTVAASSSAMSKTAWMSVAPSGARRVSSAL
ncbi:MULTISPECIES: hypothetical protein [unclassified Streptomyces]|nr:hypothetical protein [Streptomyces sp. SID4985]